MGDSFDLIPIGGWRGSGRKKRWISPWLVATYDKDTGALGSVCRVMSGFSVRQPYIHIYIYTYISIYILRYRAERSGGYHLGSLPPTTKIRAS